MSLADRRLEVTLIRFELRDFPLVVLGESRDLIFVLLPDLVDLQLVELALVVQDLLLLPCLFELAGIVLCDLVLEVCNTRFELLDARQILGIQACYL